MARHYRRRHLGGLVTEDAYAGWHGYARANGHSVSALLEVVGVWLGDDPVVPPWPQLVARARDLTADRKLRGYEA